MEIYFEVIRPVVRAYAELFSLASFLVGLYGGHRFALGRDKRKEFNALVEPIRIELLADAHSPGPYCSAISSYQSSELIRCLGFINKRKYKKAYERYKKYKECVFEDDLGQPISAFPDRISTAANDLFKILAPR